MRRYAPPGGRHPVDQVAALPRSGWQASRGIGGRYPWNTQLLLVSLINILINYLLNTLSAPLLNYDAVAESKQFNASGRLTQRISYLIWLHDQPGI